MPVVRLTPTVSGGLVALPAQRSAPDNMEDLVMDADQFAGLARAVSERGEDGAGDRDQFATLQRLIAAKGSRRLALAGLVGAGLLGQGAELTKGRCRREKGKNTRQCRRHRDQQGPGGFWDCQQDKLYGVCSFLVPEPCCNGMTCTSTVDPFVTACQLLCTTDNDCKKKFPNKALACRTDLLVCPIQAALGNKCCVPL